MEIDHWGGLWIIQQRSVHLYEPPPIINSNSSGKKKKNYNNNNEIKSKHDGFGNEFNF